MNEYMAIAFIAYLLVGLVIVIPRMYYNRKELFCEYDKLTLCDRIGYVLLCSGATALIVMVWPMFIRIRIDFS